MENSNQPVIINKSPGTWWKVLLGIGAAGVAWFAFSSFKLNALPPADEPIPDDPNKNMTHNERYEINLWKYGILKSGTEWPKKIMQEAKQMGITFEQRLNDVAIDHYVSKGHNGGKTETYFTNAVRGTIIKIRQSAKWMENIKQQAEQNGITIQEQLERTAMYVILNKLMKPYIFKRTGGQPHPSGQQRNNQQEPQNEGGRHQPPDRNHGHAAYRG